MSQRENKGEEAVIIFRSSLKVSLHVDVVNTMFSPSSGALWYFGIFVIILRMEVVFQGTGVHSHVESRFGPLRVPKSLNPQQLKFVHVRCLTLEFRVSLTERW